MNSKNALQRLRTSCEMASKNAMACCISHTRHAAEKNGVLADGRGRCLFLEIRNASWTDPLVHARIHAAVPVVQRKEMIFNTQYLNPLIPSHAT
jgi:hypothetical protein